MGNRSLCLVEAGQFAMMNEVSFTRLQVPPVFLEESVSRHVNFSFQQDVDFAGTGAGITAYSDHVCRENRVVIRLTLSACMILAEEGQQSLRKH